MASSYSITDLCRALGVPRSSYYAWRQRPAGPRAQDNAHLRQEISRLFVEHRQVYGSPRLTALLRQQGVCCSRKRVARHMRALGICAQQKRAFHPRTTDSRHDHPVAPNRLAQAAPVQQPNCAWVADITYLWTVEGWLYLAAVMDLCSRKIVGWALSRSLKTNLVKEALLQALAKRRPAPGLLHHSDRGTQYASGAFQALLLHYQIIPSMSGAGHCYDNAAMESFWSTLKTEALHRLQLHSAYDARHAVFDYIETFYNPKRLHSSLDYRSPNQFEHDLTRLNTASHL